MLVVNRREVIPSASTIVATSPMWYSQKSGRIHGATIATNTPPKAPPADTIR